MRVNIGLTIVDIRTPPLPFDFAILNEKDDVKALIEYDGEQHFKPIDIFGGEEALKETRLRDSIKNEYCVKNNIKLIRISYYKKDNIKEILSEELCLISQ